MPARSARKGSVVPSTVEHVEVLSSEGLRWQDKAELKALEPGKTPREILQECVLLSLPFAFTVLVDGKPEGLFGVSPYTKEIGSPWLLGTENLRLVGRQLVREGQEWVNYFNRLYPSLQNIVSVENTVSRRWLGRLGFTFHEEVLIHGTKFVRFERCAVTEPSL